MNVKNIWWTMIISLALILSVGLLSGVYSRRTGEEMQLIIRRIVYEMENDAWENAAMYAETLSEKWDKQSGILQLWGVHEDADDVAEGIGKLQVAIAEKERTLGKMMCEELMQNSQHLYHRDALKIKNIF